MSVYKLGSHNSMSYLPPKQWWMKPFHFIAKCQNKNIKQQYESGVRMFDFRVKWNNKDFKWEFAHGFMIFKTDDIYDYLEYLNSRQESVYIRLILEYNKEPYNIKQIEDEFKTYVTFWEQKYSNIIFTGFNRKYDWKEVCPSVNNPSIYQAVSSMTGSIIEDWLPWLYAKTHNKDILKQGTDKDFLLMDFI